MAKIAFVKLDKSEDDFSDYPLNGVLVRVGLSFSEFEVQSHFRYQLHFFIYGFEERTIKSSNCEAPIDYSSSNSSPTETKLLASGFNYFIATEPEFIVEQYVAINMKEGEVLTGLKVNAIVLPDNCAISKWSNEYYMNIELL